MGGQVRAQDIEVPFIAVDRESGTVLLEYRAFDRWYPASLTKLMTVYVALDAVRAGKLQLGSPVVISNTAVRQPPSKMGYAVGTRLRLDTALKILVVKSANDVAVAVGEAVSGNIDDFVGQMNATAQRIGMADSRFANSHGLHDEGQFVTARDMALLARQLLTDFPEQAEWFAIPAIRTGEKIHYSYNLLLERFDGADGMKTGFVCASGYNMVASATRSGRQTIAVVLGTFSQTERAEAAARILLDAFEKTGGLTITQYRPLSTPKPAINQRPTMCSEQARQTRYDPGAGDAKIESPYLTERQISSQPLSVSSGGIDAPASEAAQFAKYLPGGKVPVPAPRPEFVRKDVDGVKITEYTPPTGSVPVPVRRPAITEAN